MKVVSCRFYKCLRSFNMTTVKGCSETVFFLESGLTKSLTVSNFWNKGTITIIFFFKMFEIWFRSQKWNKRKKRFVFLKIIVFESGTTNSHNLEQVTCHWQSMCYKTPLGFNISLRGIFSKSGSLRVMKKYYECVLMQILQEFGTF